MTDRDQVFAEFALRQFVHGWSADAEHWQVNAMADEIVRLRDCLAAVEAAEKEVSTAHGLTKRVLDVVQSGERGEPLPPIREAMDALMKEASDDPR